MTSFTFDDLLKIVEIDAGTVMLLTQLIKCEKQPTLTQQQIRAVILGDFLITQSGVKATSAINIITQIVNAVDLALVGELNAILEILDNSIVILLTNGAAEPLFICNKNGMLESTMPEIPPVMILTIILNNLFAIASV